MRTAGRPLVRRMGPMMRRDRFWHDLGRACCEAVFYRRAIFDPPGWQHRFRLFLPVKRVRR